MKKALFIILIIAAVYPYARSYYQNHYLHSNAPEPQAIEDFIDKINSSLPRKQGLLTFDRAVEATGSVIFLITDSMGISSQLSQNEAQERINTWTPFLVDQTCRNTILASALKKGIVNNIYYQISVKGGLTSYGKIGILPEMCL